MKKLSLITLMLAVLTVPNLGSANSTPHVFLMDRCSCSSTDGSCDASITCQSGCTSFCEGGGGCNAYCSGFYAALRSKTPTQMQNDENPQLVNEIDKSIPTTLSDLGTVKLSEQDFEKLKKLRKILLSGKQISLCVRNTPISTFVSDMASLTGLPLRITPNSPKAIVDIKLRSVTLDDILARISEQTGTIIINESADHHSKL